MCGIVGIISPHKDLNAIVFEELMLQSQIRGKHSTGIAFLNKENKLEVDTKPLPVSKYLEKSKVPQSTILLGHTRYSTSDIHFRQPLMSHGIALSHNGVITQEDPKLWGKYFDENEEDFATNNDSELLLKSFNFEENPFSKFPKASVAAGLIVEKDKQLVCFRNYTRPLWKFNVNYEMFGFASTGDIIKRAFRKIGVNAVYSMVQPYKFHYMGINDVDWKTAKIKHLDEGFTIDQQVPTKVAEITD